MLGVESHPMVKFLSGQSSAHNYRIERGTIRPVPQFSTRVGQMYVNEYLNHQAVNRLLSKPFGASGTGREDGEEQHTIPAIYAQVVLLQGYEMYMQ